MTGASFPMPLTVLTQPGVAGEWWCIQEPVSCVPLPWSLSAMPGARWRQVLAGDYLLIGMDWDEMKASTELTPCLRAGVTQQVYQKAIGQAAAMGFTTVARIWNYLPKINEKTGTLDGYQLFCQGRESAFRQLRDDGHWLQAQLPAATAIGTADGRWQFVFLFLREVSFQALENPRQVPAWEYPQIYSPSKPGFSRAVMVGSSLLCSGTASVIGHATVHHDNVRLQCEESLRNIRVLLIQAARNGPVPTLGEGVYRVYVRHAADAPAVDAIVKRHGITNFSLLQGEVCRSNLLVECEAVFECAAACRR